MKNEVLMRSSHKLRFKRRKCIHSIEQPLISLDFKYFIIQMKLGYLKSILQSRSSLLPSYCMLLRIIQSYVRTENPKSCTIASPNIGTPKPWHCTCGCIVCIVYIVYIRTRWVSVGGRCWIWPFLIFIRSERKSYLLPLRNGKRYIFVWEFRPSPLGGCMLKSLNANAK